jgi:SOS-response transcriptional repressor LexA
MAGTEPRSNDSPRPAWAKAIRDLRLRLKLSQSDLGGRIGFSAMTISRWERGTMEPPSNGYIGLGILSRNATCWFFWERAGLRSEDVLRALPILKRVSQASLQHHIEIVTAGSGPRRVEEKVQLVGIPLLKVAVAGYGERSDNLPLLTDAPVENMIAAPKNWCPNPSFTSCLRVRGNSMAPSIQDGFIVAVDSSDTDASKLHGKVVIAWHKDKGLTISRFRRYDHTDVLQPENSEYQAVTLSVKNSWKIVARVLWWIGKAP